MTKKTKIATVNTFNNTIRLKDLVNTVTYNEDENVDKVIEYLEGQGYKIVKD